MHVDDDFRIFQNNTLKELRADIEKFPLPAVRLVLHSAIDDITYRKK
jgi:hypothetical protein